MNQPPLGADCEMIYPSSSVQLSLRERIVLVVDEAARRTPKFSEKIISSFAQLNVESHRRMMAADAVAFVRDFYEKQSKDAERLSASIVAVRRR